MVAVAVMSTVTANHDQRGDQVVDRPCVTLRGLQAADTLEALVFETHAHSSPPAAATSIAS